MGEPLQVVVQITAQTAGLASTQADFDKLQAQFAAINAEQVETVEKLVQQTAIQSELQAIAQTRFNLEAARVEGNAAGVAQLQAELGIRNATLGVLRAETFSAAELNRLTETEAGLLAKSATAVEGVAAGGLLAEVNFGRAGAEMTTLARETATGSVNARTLGALLGSLGTTLTVAGIAGYGLFESVSKLGQDWRDVDAEINKSSDDLNEQILIWDDLAGRAGKFADVVAIGEKQVAELTKLTKELAQIQAKPVGVIDSITDFATKIPEIIKNGLVNTQTILPGILSNILKDTGPNATAKDDEAKRKQEEINRGLLTSIETQDKGTASAESWKNTLSELPSKALDEYNSKLTDAKVKLDALSTNRGQSAEAFKAWQDQQKVVEQVSARVETLRKRQADYATAVGKSADETKLLNDEASGNDQAVIADKVKTAFDAIYKSKLAAHVPDAEAKQLAVEQSQALGQQLTHQLALRQAKLGARDATIAERDAQKDLNTFLRDQETILEGIKGKEGLIQSDPFLAVDSKQEQLHNAALQAELTLQNQIAAVKAKIASLPAIGGPSDQKDASELNKKLQQFNLTLIKTQQEIKATTFGGALKADLANWVNSFGVASHQITNTIEGTIGAAFSTLNEGILTGKFNVQDLEKSIISLGLQLIEQLALQRIASLLNITASTATAEVAGPAVAKAWAPAAAAASIASYGGADYAAIGAASSAIGVIEGLLSGTGGGGGSLPGLADGGRIPGSPSRTDTVHALLAQHETVIPAYESQRVDDILGHSDWFANISDYVAPPSRIRFADGGRAGASFLNSPAAGSSARSGRSSTRPQSLKVVVVQNLQQAMKEARESRENEVHIVDTVGKLLYATGLR